MVATFFDLAGASQPFDRAVMLTISLQLCYCMRQQETLREYIERLIELAGQYEMSFWQAVGALFQGWSWIQSGEDQAGLSSMIDGIKGMEQAGAGVFTLFLSMLAAAYVQTGHFVEAKTTLQRALDYADSGGEHFWYAELQRQMADTLHAQGCPIAEVEMWYQQSLQTARDQGARSLELRAAVGLCWHWRDHGRPHAARDLLAPLYASFTEGFDTADLIEAKELLQQLS
jgi:predicted ATPase